MKMKNQNRIIEALVETNKIRNAKREFYKNILPSEIVSGLK